MSIIVTFAEANSELEDVAEAIETKTQELTAAREKYLLAKDAYEFAYSRHLLETKVREPDMVQSEIIAQAKVLSHDARLEAIKAESVYKKIMEDLRSLRDRLDAAREISYNLRREVRI